MSGNVEEWIDLADFTPGIWSDFHAASGLAAGVGSQMSVLRNGAATIENTYRCCASPSGALGPLPRGVAGAKSQTLLPEGNAATAGFEGAIAAAYLTDALITTRDETHSFTAATSPIRDLVWPIYQFWYSPAGDGLPGSQCRQYVLGRRFEPRSGPTVAMDWAFHRGDSGILVNISGALNSPITPAWVELIKHFEGTNEVYPMIVHSATTAAFQTKGELVAYDLPLTTFETDIRAADNQYQGGEDGTLRRTTVYRFPRPNPSFALDYQDQSTGDVGALRDTGTTMGPGAEVHTLFTGHQGRMVLAAVRRIQMANGVPTLQNQVLGTDLLIYNAPSIYPAPARLLFPLEDSTSQFGAMVSMNANELFLVKANAGGGVVIRGDLDNPQIIRLPQVVPTGGIVAQAIACPLGAVYASRFGIFAWKSGDTAYELSKQLDGFFWDFRDGAVNLAFQPENLQTHGRLAWWEPWVCVPGNWLYDSRIESWWRLENPADRAMFNVYRVGDEARLYGFHYKLTPTQNRVWTEYKPHDLASSYSWQSQPLLETTDRRLSFHEVELVAQRAPNSTGTCTVAVTLTGINEDGSTVAAVTETFTLAANANPQHQVQTVKPNFTARYVQVRIVSTAATSGPAPKVHRVRFGVREAQRTPRS